MSTGRRLREFACPVLRRIPVVGVAVLFLITCAPGFERAPERSFTTMDLLIGLSDMPAGWRSYAPFRPVTDVFCVGDCASIDFEADSGSPLLRAYQDVFRYRSSRVARLVYEENVVLPGKTPLEWTYQSPVADRSRIACYDYEGREPPDCQWVGQYEEYLVVFRSRLIPGRMSLADMKSVVSAIDARMARYLGRPVADSQN